MPGRGGYRREQQARLFIEQSNAVTTREGAHAGQTELLG